MSALVSEAPSTLADLVSPLTLQEFLDLLRRRELAYRPGSNGERYAPLLGWEGLRHILATGGERVKLDGILVTKESASVSRERWMTDSRIDPAKLDGFLAKGFSIVILNIEEHIPALAAICEEIKTRTREGALVGAIVTSSARIGAFKVHFDPEDLIILQLEGTKRWQVFGPVVPNPIRRMPKQSLENPEPILDEVLEPGDLLFVPGGYWHRCESGLSTSVHLGVFFVPPTGWHAIDAVIQPLISEEMFRRPLTRLDSETTLKTLETELKSRVIEKIEALKLADFVARWHKMAY